MGCTADWIALAIVVVSLAVGAIVGFGKLLVFFTNKVFGWITSAFVCYTFGGMIMKIEFVQDLLVKMASLWSGTDNIFLAFITNIHPEVILFYIVMFIAVFFIIKLLALLAKSILEIESKPLKVINAIGGALLLGATMILMGLVALQIIYWVGGNTSEVLLENLDHSLFGLDKLYLNNPLLGLVEMVKGST